MQPTQQEMLQLLIRWTTQPSIKEQAATADKKPDDPAANTTAVLVPAAFGGGASSVQQAFFNAVNSKKKESEGPRLLGSCFSSSIGQMSAIYSFIQQQAQAGGLESQVRREDAKQGFSASVFSHS